MGLDIGAYKNVRKVDVSELDDDEYEDMQQVFCNGFKEQYSGLEVGSYYDGEYEWFCRISYGAYSLFRDRLAEIGGWNKHLVDKPHFSDNNYENKNYFHRFPHIAGVYNTGNETVDGPFVEIIIFSDCEGFIDSKNCKKLYDDFCKYEDKAKEVLHEEDRFLKFYLDLKESFKYGSQSGFVWYH